jgi:hypothetical protein
VHVTPAEPQKLPGETVAEGSIKARSRLRRQGKTGEDDEA